MALHTKKTYKTALPIVVHFRCSVKNQNMNLVMESVHLLSPSIFITEILSVSFSLANNDYSNGRWNFYTQVMDAQL